MNDPVPHVSVCALVQVQSDLHSLSYRQAVAAGGSMSAGNGNISMLVIPHSEAPRGVSPFQNDCS